LFLSNDELLEIFAETKDPLRVHAASSQEIVLKELHHYNSKIHLISVRCIQLKMKWFNLWMHVTNPKQAAGSVEMWLLEVERVMRA